MDWSGGHGITPQYPPNNSIGTVITPRNQRQQQKRTREAAAQDGKPETASGERRQKKQRRSSDDTFPPNENNVDSSSLFEVAIAAKENQNEKKDKQRKSSELLDPSSYEDRCFTNHELSGDFTSIVHNLATVNDPPMGDPHLEPSEHYPQALPSINSNDDVLRALQALDFSRLAGVLRGLEPPSADVDLNTNDTSFVDLLGPNYFIDDQVAINDTVRTHPSGYTDVPVSASSSALVHNIRRIAECSTAAQGSSKSTTPNTNPCLLAGGPSVTSAEHTEMLATKWLNAGKLKELVVNEGLVYKKGKFSAIEQQALRTAVENYRVTSSLSHEQMLEVIYSKRREEHGNFWTEITASVPARPIIAVYHYIHRAYDPLRLQGKWTDEQDAALISAVGDLGQAWQKVKDRVGRSASDCRDRWRNYLVDRSERQRGTWSKAEEEELTRIVQELTTEQGKSADNDVFWTIISQRMGNKRGRQQCRIKWTDSLNKTVKNGGEKPRWKKHDTYVLVHKVASMEVRDDSEIDWKLVSDDDWNLWSPHTLQRQWRQLKHAIKGHDEMAFQEMIEILKQKCTVQPEVLGDPGHDVKKAGKRPPKSPKKVKSAAVIDDKWEDEMCESEEQG